MKRDKSIDLLKGIGIILVIFAHTYSKQNFNNYIYMFHMPLFFFLSGLTFYYTLNKRITFKELFTKKFYSLIIPYIIFLSLSLVYWIFIERQIRGQTDISVFQQILNIFIARISGDLYASNIVMWFLPTLFISTILTYFINKIKNNTIKYIVSIILLIIGYILSINKIILPLTLETAFIAQFFINLAIFIKFKNLKINIFTLIISILSMIIAYCFNDTINMLGHSYGNILLFIMGSVSVILILLFLTSNKESKILECIGQKSLTIMCLHEPLKRIIIKIFSLLMGLNTEVIRENILYSIIIVIIIILLLIPTDYILNKYFPFIFGKFKKHQIKEV